jgi:hypothetical protein
MIKSIYYLGFHKYFVKEKDPTKLFYRMFRYGQYHFSHRDLVPQAFRNIMKGLAKIVDVEDDTLHNIEILGFLCFYLPETAAILINRGWAIDVNEEYENHNFALLSAAAHNQVDLIEVLLNHGARIDARCFGGNTPLTAAIQGGNIAAGKLLLARGADPNLRNNNMISPFNWIVSLFVRVYHKSDQKK